jgi:hypothetical protein
VDRAALPAGVAWLLARSQAHLALTLALALTLTLALALTLTLALALTLTLARLLARRQAHLEPAQLLLLLRAHRCSG